MSKRSSTSDDPTNAPVTKRPRIDIDNTVVKTLGAQLLDALKIQKAAVQWGHTTCRDDTMANITKTELLINSIEELGKKSKDAVEKLIDALVKSEINTLTKALEKYSLEECGCHELPDASILHAVQKHEWDITHDVKKQLKDKLKDLTVDEIIKKVPAETKSANKAAAKKKLTDVLESVWA